MRASAEAIAALAAYDTPTILNGLERIDEASRLTGYTRATMVRAPDGFVPPHGGRAICGRAKTARIGAGAHHGRDEAQNAALRMAYYDHVADADGPTIVVLEDLDAEPVGSFWGEVNSAVHRALGAHGVVTNGLIRDLEDLDPAFMLLAGGIGPSHAWVHLVDFGEGATVFAMAVREGDVVHADRHGATVVPEEAVARLPEAIAEVAAKEARVLELARAPSLDRAALRRVMTGSAEEPH